MLEKINTKTQEIFEKIVNIRREIHQNPELAFNEFNTSEIICNFLKENNIEFKKNVAKTGVVATIYGKNKGKTLAIRADMDALLIDEKNNCSYKSKNKGIMHACGHDAHTSMLLGTAFVLNTFKDELCGNVKFIFQPAEEGVGGALPMIDEGVLENPQVDAVIATHISPDIDVGKIGIKSGVLTASPDNFEIIIKGKGGHGAHPQTAVDPIVIGSMVVNAIQTVVSRNTDPLSPAVVTIGYFNSGTGHNIIPDIAKIGGTIRTFDKELRYKIPKQIESIVSGITKAMGGDYEFKAIFLYPPLFNNKELTDAFYNSAAKIVNHNNIMLIDAPSMIGEDFAYFAEKVPSTMFYLGCKNVEKGITKPLHNSNFNIDENCMKIGITLFSSFAVDYLNSYTNNR